jgi:hypothetical protein
MMWTGSAGCGTGSMLDGGDCRFVTSLRTTNCGAGYFSSREDRGRDRRLDAEIDRALDAPGAAHDDGRVALLGLGGKLGIDATNKAPPETTRTWGRPIRMDDATQKQVTRRWQDYGIPVEP